MKGTKSAADLKISQRYLRKLCEAGRVIGAEKIGKTWIIPGEVIILAAARGGKKSKIDMRAKSAAPVIESMRE